MRLYNYIFRCTPIIAAGIALLISRSNAQTTFAQQIQQQFVQYQSQAFTEKIYLHTDRNFYVAGEIMWFKAYIADGASGYLSEISKVAYIEIINRENKPVLQAKIATGRGTGNGSFYIPVNMPSGNYRLRAYTNWMKNFDAGFYFEKNITIVNTLTGTGLPPADSTSAEDLQFFPEGGNLIQDIPCRIAFRMTDHNGKGVEDYSGVIINDTNDTVAHFAPLHAGIGSFAFTASAGHQYMAIVKGPGQIPLRKQLPQALLKGYSMHLSKPSSQKIMIEVKTNPGNITGNDEVYLFAHTRGVVQLAEARKIQSGSAIFNIEEAALGEGITHFTLFNRSRQPVCERLYFRKPGQPLIISAGTNSSTYTTRDKITLDISTNAPLTVAANMSLSIYRADSLQAKENSDIYSFLWLTSELQGTVEDPSYYFTHNDAKANEALDNVMLSHGWRRFRWTDIQNNISPAFTFLPEYEGHIVTGKITDTVTKKPVPEAIVFLSFPGEYTQFYCGKSAVDGSLRFYTRNVYGPGEMVVRGEGLNETKYNIEINTPFSNTFSQRNIPVLSLSPSLKSSLETNSIAAQVQRKFAGELLRQYSFPPVDTSAFYGKADESYLLDDYTRFTTLEEVLREYVPGIMVGKSGGKFHLTAFDLPNNRFFRDNPLVLLDGVPIADMDKVMSYDPLKIKKLQVIKRRYYYGPLLLNGIMNMITYKGNMEGLEMDPSAIVVDFDGMQLQREFYMPVYDSPEKQQNHLPDFRNLLYWSPDITTNDDNGRATIDIYSGDLEGKYIGIVEGMTPGGKAGSATFSFEVKK
ncbi:MAG: hypothetical protein J0H29_11975 [Sphingobacteriales bacterium]|nr:hypothetical protein [Sphingobacteriales bacterium]